MKPISFCLNAAFVGAMLSLVSVGHAQSGPTGPTPPPFTPVVVITPAVAAVGVERRIVVSGQWPNGCPPVALTATLEGSAFTRALPLRLEVPLTLVACTTVITSYQFTTTYTPNTAGDYRVIAYALGGTYINEVAMAVQSTDANRSLYNLAGMWYEPRTSGSGLIFAHNYTGTDAVFGAWFLYDQQGLARWYSIQEGRWTNGTEHIAVLYETVAAPASCSMQVSICPLPFRTLRRVGTVKITMNGRFDAKVDATGFDGTALFSSTVVRN